MHSLVMLLPYHVLGEIFSVFAVKELQLQFKDFSNCHSSLLVPSLVVISIEYVPTCGNSWH